MKSHASGSLTLIQQNDTHGQLELHWELFRRHGQIEHRRVGGYARTATIVQAIKQETGVAVFCDCGDTLHGTGPTVASEGQVVIPALNAVGVEVMTPGNWEIRLWPRRPPDPC